MLADQKLLEGLKQMFLSNELKIDKIFFIFLFIFPFLVYSQYKEINLFEKKLQEKQFSLMVKIIFRIPVFLSKKRLGFYIGILRETIKCFKKNKNPSDYYHYSRDQCFSNKKFCKEAQS